MERRFVGWVEPVARSLADDRGQLLAAVESADAAFWDRASVVEGWTNKEILAHLAGGNDMLLQTILRALADGVELDPAALAPDTDAENAWRVAERREWPVEDLAAELRRDHEEVLGWLARLSDEDRDVRPRGLGMTVGEFLRVVQEEHHDLIHLAQLRDGGVP